jgi:nitrate reductase gamma subunit
MERLTQILHAFKYAAIQHPYLTGTVALFGIAVLVLRRIHQRFVVYPSI